MTKSWGVARFYGMGSMEYLLESGEWLHDGKLFNGAPVRLFETIAEADDFSAQFPQSAQPHGVQFMVDANGKVMVALKKSHHKVNFKDNL